MWLEPFTVSFRGIPARTVQMLRHCLITLTLMVCPNPRPKEKAMRASFITFLTPLSLMVCAISQAAPPTQTFHGRGVHRFDAAVCPLPEIGSLKQACNRVAIDDDGSTVEVNPTALTIVFHNERNYSSKQLVGD